MGLTPLRVSLEGGVFTCDSTLNGSTLVLRVLCPGGKGVPRGVSIVVHLKFGSGGRANRTRHQHFVYQNFLLRIISVVTPASDFSRDNGGGVHTNMVWRAEGGCRDV